MYFGLVFSARLFSAEDQLWASAHCSWSLHHRKHWVGVKDFSKGLRHAVPVGFSVAMETDCVNSAVWQSLQPRGHVSKLHWAAWVYLSSEPTPTGTGPGSLSTHSAGTSAVSLPRRRGLAGLFWADSLLPHFTVIQPTLWTERGWGKSQRNSWSHDEHEMVFLAEMSEWKAFPSNWRTRVPFADRQCGYPLMSPSNTLSHQFLTHTHTHTQFFLREV